jgi:hypothetical protein
MSFIANHDEHSQFWTARLAQFNLISREKTIGLKISTLSNRRRKGIDERYRERMINAKQSKLETFSSTFIPTQHATIESLIEFPGVRTGASHDERIDAWKHIHKREGRIH